MSINVSDIVSGSYTLLGRPSQGDLPFNDVLSHVADVVRGRTVDLKLDARNHTMQVGPWVTPSGREMSSSGFVGGLENFIPVKVEWRYLAAATVSPSPQPKKVTVISYEQLGEFYEKELGDETYCAFYDGFANIAFSENTTELSLRQYRILYEDTSDISVASTSDTVNLPEIFVTLCKYETALICLDQIRNYTPEWMEERERLRAQFTGQVMMWSDRFNKFAKTRFGNKKYRKQGFRPRMR